MISTLTKSLCLLAVLSIALSQNATNTSRPIIGVVSVPSEWPEVYDPDVYSSIHGTIISFVESGGARVAPIPWNVTQDQLTALLHSVNGIVITGDSTQLYTKNILGKRTATPYANRLEEILSYAISTNQNGEYFPVVGINMGFAALASLVAGDVGIIEETGRSYKDGSKTFKLNGPDSKSKMFSFFTTDQLSYLEANSVIGFNNTYSVKASTFDSNADLKSFFKVTSTYRENLLSDCVATAEANDYPIYLLQFSPQIGRHSADTNDLGATFAIKTAYTQLTNFFASEMRQNANAFDNSSDEDESLIYQFDPEFMGIRDPRVFFFDDTHFS